jgi:hypothetical protein
MNDPIRLIDEHPSPVARSLLSAGLGEEPPPSLLERTLAPLGVGVATTVLAHAAQAGTAGVATGVVSTAPPAAVTAGASLFVTTVKWVGIAGIGGGLLVGAARGLSPSSPPAEAPAEIVRALPATTSIAAPTLHRPLVVDDRARETPAAVASMPTPRLSGRTSRATTDAEAKKRSALLAEEAKAIDEAREAVATGDAARALSVLDAHRQKFDKPLLEPEALFLEMRALRARGDPSAAARVAEELLRRYPSGPQAAAARAFLRTQGR